MDQIFKNLATGHHLYHNNEYMPYFKHHVDITGKFNHARKLHFKSLLPGFAGKLTLIGMRQGTFTSL